ncbi:hypothetical protein DND90_30575 [Pseudomonas syringae pv. maculicola]|nr:hypothetical protein DND90_30575 [Pseudomonas syringae pv. maculicola]
MPVTLISMLALHPVRDAPRQRVRFLLQRNVMPYPESLHINKALFIAMATDDATLRGDRSGCRVSAKEPTKSGRKRSWDNEMVSPIRETRSVYTFRVSLTSRRSLMKTASSS